MADIFVSYASEDRERAKAIAQALEQQGWSVWWDRVIPPGKQWADVIESEINAARCVVVLWSKVSVRGDWVKKEARAGLRRRILVPALIEPADPPFEFEDIQAADLIGWSGEISHPELKKMFAAIAEHAGPPPAATRAGEEAEARARAEAEARERREREAQAREEEAQAAARREKEAREQAERHARAEAEAKAKAEAEAQAKREASAKAEAEATARAEEQVRAQAKAGRPAQADAGLIARKEVRAPAEPEMLSQEKPRTSSAGRWLLAGVAAVILLGVFSFWDAAQEKRRTEETETERQATEEKAARARRAEEEAWALAERIGTREALRDYLARVERREIPGVHEGDAQKRLQELQRAEEGKKAAAEARVQAEPEARLEADTRAQEERKKAEARARADAEAKAKPATLSPGQVFRDCADCPEMVVIPAGEFTMGSPEGERGRQADEGPQRRVKIARSFALGRFEVTVGQFRRFVEATGYSTEAEGDAANGCVTWSDTEKKAVLSAGKSWRGPGFSQGDDHPVVCVSWNDATKYLQWLSTKTGKPYRLPSEAEWEYAARAGTKTARYWGDDPNQACRYANVADRRAKAKHPDWVVHDCDDGYAETAPAGRFEPNRFKLYDMLGNAWEWAEDCWNGSYEGAPSDGSAWESGDCGWRVLRGGSWNNFSPELARVAVRIWFQPVNRVSSIGFRVARTL